MTNEQVELLVKDLSARTPYGVMVWVNGVFHDPMDERLEYIDFYNRIHLCGYNFGITIAEPNCGDKEIKPYLRPLISMTESEAVEYFRLQTNNPYAEITDFKIEKDTWCLAANVNGEHFCYCWGDISNFKTFDWLNQRMFDYRGLIYDGLALNAPTGMYEFLKQQ